jgi:hypothetical protein
MEGKFLIDLFSFLQLVEGGNRDVFRDRKENFLA